MWSSAQKEELIGRRFGRLRVVSLADKAPDGRAQYHCICDCGHMRIVTGKNLKSGNTTSCGCKRIERCKAGVKDLTGQRFGRLLVLKRAGTSKLRTATWLCKCDCGATCEVSGSYLRQGDTRSCGCYQRESISARSFKDITGCRFGKLTVIKRLQNYNDGKQGVHWLCLCDCGNEIVALADNLLEGNQRSCGCLKTSSGEYEICQFLNDNGIPFCREKTFSDCKDKKQLRFDFYLTEQRTVIEFQGTQHYSPIEYFGGDEAFQIRLKHDQIKRDYCRGNGIRQIEINYTQQSEINVILSRELGIILKEVKRQCRESLFRLRRQN